MLHCNIPVRYYLSRVLTCKRELPPVSKQLAISSAFSIFAMVAFVLFAVPQENAAGAKAEASAPVIMQVSADLQLLGN